MAWTYAVNWSAVSMRALGVCRIFVATFLLFAAALMSAPPAQASGAGTSGDPFTALAGAYSVASGRYWFDTGSGSFQADVDNSEGGGWVLAERC